jgi:hypothetical protein
LACIPLREYVPIKDVAALSGVSHSHLARVIRLTATASFLNEPQPDQVCHTALSTPFVTDPGYLDAVMFFAESAAPAALKMGRDDQQPRQPNQSAYNIALKSPQPFRQALEEQPRLRRKFHAYFQHAAGLHAAIEGDEGLDTAMDILSQLNWSLGGDVQARIVEVKEFSLIF